MYDTLIVHDSNIVSRYAYMIERRMNRILDLKRILENSESYGYKVDLEQVAFALKSEAECLDDIIKELQAGAKSTFLGPELENIRKKYVEEVVGDAAE